MRKIFEFKVFDILQNKENVEFLDKVKIENPELYTKFLNLIGNKGLDVAKEKYNEHDPEYKKKLDEEEKKRIRYIKKTTRDKYREDEDNRLLNKYKPEIEKIDKIINSSELNKIDLFINNDENISKYFKAVDIKRKHVNDFSKLLKNPSDLDYLRGYFHIDTISYEMNRINFYTIKKEWLLKIHQYYNLKTNDFKYSIHFDPDTFEEYNTPRIDRSKENDFIIFRNLYISKLGNSNKIDIDSVYDILYEYSTALSDTYYDNWKVINDTEKFNI